jgi:hypothetical protein
MNIHPVSHVSLLELYHAFIILGRTHEPTPPITVDDEQKMKLKKS